MGVDDKNIEMYVLCIFKGPLDPTSNEQQLKGKPSELDFPSATLFS